MVWMMVCHITPVAVTVEQNMSVPGTACAAAARSCAVHIGLAQHWLRQGRPLKWVAGEVGYAGEAALSCAFKARCGVSVRDWRRQLAA